MINGRTDDHGRLPTGPRHRHTGSVQPGAAAAGPYGPLSPGPGQLSPGGPGRPGVSLVPSPTGPPGPVPPWPIPPRPVPPWPGALETAAPPPGETLDFADFITSRMISPAGFLGATPTALVGRAADLDRLAAVLADPAAGLVTVTGPAGVGKSRLVMEFFRQQPAAPGGVAEVLDFGQVADAARCGRMLRQFRERCQRGSHAARADLERLGAGRHTVLLDHFEDVAGELAPLLVEFRRCCPQVRVVCVGTTRLGLYGERVVRLQPLP